VVMVICVDDSRGVHGFYRFHSIPCHGFTASTSCGLQLSRHLL
jgi:hypothetical protein